MAKVEAKAMPAELVEQVRELVRQQGALQTRLQDIVSTAALVLRVPADWQFDLGTGSFVAPAGDEKMEE